MKILGLAAVAVTGFVGMCSAATSSEWAQQSIYQVMVDRFAQSDGSTDAECDLYTYCGGTWKGLVKKLDYIQNMGFTAVQISPVVANIENNTKYGEAYHGYWPKDLFSVNSHFGTADDLKNLAEELHNRDMYLMVDVVINDMAIAISGVVQDDGKDLDYASLNPFNDIKYYHSYCNITDWSNETDYQDCWFSVEYIALPDLATEQDNVKNELDAWVKELVSNYSIDGLRIDAAKHVNRAFLPSFVSAAGVFTFGEVYNADVATVCGYQNDSIAGLPNYPVYFPLIQAFTNGKMKQLASMVEDVESGCKDFTALGTFAENHDLPRFASYVTDMALAKNALAFVILADGIPTVYEGQEQHLNGNYSPYNREAIWKSGYATDAPLYNLTATLNTLRNHAISVDSHYVSNHSMQLYVDDSTYATRKGPEGVQIVSVFSNQGSKGGKYTLNIPGAFTAGTVAIEVINCTTVTANADGNITVSMGAGLPKVFFPKSNLNGSGLCGTESSTATSSGSATTTSSTSKPTHSKSAADQAVFLNLPTLVTCVLSVFAFWLI